MAIQIEKNQLTEMVGTELGVSEWIKLGQTEINQFADVTHDHQFIHTDPEKAKKTPFGDTIAHGMFVLSLLPKVLEETGIDLINSKMTMNYGFDKVRFLSPVIVNSEVRGSIKLIAADEKKPGQYLLKYQITVEIKNSNNPALIAEQLALVIV
jgi:acyl dehydratase